MIKDAQHVVPKSGGRWSVRKTGASRASKVFNKREDAVYYARTRAKKAHSEIYIHRVDGTVIKRDSYKTSQLPPLPLKR